MFPVPDQAQPVRKMNWEMFILILISGINFWFPLQHSIIWRRNWRPRWLGMDNGEQDGRYIGGFADQMSLIGSSREQQYLNFQNHFQGLGDRLGNKLATLVSLNYGHYFLKEGIYTMIGAETAQALPNSQSITPLSGGR
jgi:hypothetical protein